MNSQEFYPFRTYYCRFIQIHAWDQSRNIDNLSHVHPVPSSSSTNIFSPVWSPTSIEKTPHNPTLISISTHPSILRAVSEIKFQPTHGIYAFCMIERAWFRNYGHMNPSCHVHVTGRWCWVGALRQIHSLVCNRCILLSSTMCLIVRTHGDQCGLSWQEMLSVQSRTCKIHAVGSLGAVKFLILAGVWYGKKKLDMRSDGIKVELGLLPF